MKKSLWLALFLWCSGITVLNAQCVNQIKWKKTMGGRAEDEFQSVIPTNDGGYIAIGSTNSIDGDIQNHPQLNANVPWAHYDIWVVKFNSKNQIEWQKEIGGSLDEKGFSISQTLDGGYIIGGYTNSFALNDALLRGDVTYDGRFGNGDHSVIGWVIKLDLNGNKQWDKTFSRGNSEIIRSIIQTKDKGYIFAATSDDPQKSYSDIWVVKVNEKGDMEWDKTYGSTKNDFATKVIQTIDDGYAVLGTVNSNDGDVSLNVLPNWGGTWLLKLGKKGDKEWEFGQYSSYHGNFSTSGKDEIYQNQDGSYLLGTQIKGNQHLSDVDILITMLDNNGAPNKAPGVKWSKSYGGKYTDVLNSFTIANDGGCILLGSVSSYDGDLTYNHGYYDLWVAKIDNKGDLQYQKSYGSSDYDYGSGITQLNDGSIAVAGFTYSTKMNDGDVDYSYYDKAFAQKYGDDIAVVDGWLLKLDPYQLTGHSYGGDLDEKVYSTIKTNDGGYIMAGYATSYDGAGVDKGDVSQNIGQKDMWVVKTDATGKIEWEKSLGGSDDDEARSIIQTKDGGYIIGGYSKSKQKEIMDGYSINNYGQSDIWVVKLNDRGAPGKAPDVEWAKNYGGSNDEIANSIVETANGYALAGYTSSNDQDVINKNRGGNAGTADMIVISIDNKGNIQNLNLLGGSQSEEAYSIIQDKNNDLVVAGYTTSDDGNVLNKNKGGNNNTQDTWIVKLDQKLNIIWDNTYGGDDNDYAKAIIETQDGGYAVAANIIGLVIPDPAGNNFTSSWAQRIIKLKTNGKQEWSQNYLTTAPNWDKANSIVQTQDGGYLLAGLAARFDNASGKGDIEYSVTKINGDYTNSSGQLIQGEKEWERYIGGDGYDEATTIIDNQNNTYTIAGYSASTKGNNGLNIADHHGKGYDYWLVNMGTCFPPAQKSNLNKEDQQIVFSSKSILYPNPATDGKFFIKLPEVNAKAVVEVYNTLGSKVFEKQKISNSEQIDLSRQPQGIYLVKIVVNNKVTTQKLVIE